MINNVTIVGRLTADIEVQKTQTGKSIAKFSVACERPKAKDAEKVTDFIRCSAFNKTAEILAQYAKKGQFLGIGGKLTSFSYEDRNGNKVSGMEVLVNDAQLIGGAPQQKPQQMQMNPTEQIWENPQNIRVDEITFPEGIRSDDLPF